MRKQPIKWRCRYVVRKYAEDITPFRGREGDFYRLHIPYEVIEHEENLLLEVGIAEIWDILIGGSANHFDNANSTIGVGDSSTAEVASQTDLQAATNKQYNGMEATYPSRTDETLSFKASFGSAEANFAWHEWVVKQGASGICLNRKVDSLGTKASGTWTLEVGLTLG